MKKPIYRWKFLREGMKSDAGDCTWTIGEWKTHRGPLEMCKQGFHCSRKAYQAFSYVHGEILAKVEVRNDHEEQSDKEVWREMRIVKAYKWQKTDSVALAIYAAEQVIDIYEKYAPTDDRPRKAIEAAKAYIKEPTEANRLASEAAAEAAARAAAWASRAAEADRAASEAAAEAAAWASRAAAWEAAWAAASRAAEAAAGAAGAAGAELIERIAIWMDKRIKKLEPHLGAAGGRGERMKLSVLFKEWRKQHGYTQTQTGELFGVSHAAVSDWENGKSDVPNRVIEYLWLDLEKIAIQPKYET